MPHYRAAFRTAVRAALAADPAFDGFKNFSAWSQTIDASELPFFAVATPREIKDAATHTSSTRDTTLVAVFKMRGDDDLENDLDDLSIPAELAILGLFVGGDHGCELLETAINLDGGAGNRVGTLTMQFTITTWPTEPVAP